jgi:hypothetical protein
LPSKVSDGFADSIEIGCGRSHGSRNGARPPRRPLKPPRAASPKTAWEIFNNV